MYIDITLALVQASLITLKLAQIYNRSWFAVLIPTIAWLSVHIMFALTHAVEISAKDAEKDKEESREG